MPRKRIPVNRSDVASFSDKQVAFSPQEILETAPDAMIVTDQSGRLLFINRMTESLFGYSRTELIGESVDILVPDRLREVHAEHRRRYREHPSTRPMAAAQALFGRRKGGTEFPVAVSLSPLFSKAQFQVIVAVRDMTEFKQIETAVWRAERMASLGNLAAGIAHEINGPVGAALLTAEVALASTLADKPLDQIVPCLRNIVSSMERCGKIVQNILKFSRNDPSDQTECDLNERIWHVEGLLESYAAAHRAVINVTARANIPRLRADPLEVEMMIGNLVRNAIESREPGAVVRITSTFNEATVDFSVSDNGAGIPENQIAHIFEPFITTRQNSGGTGLGLGIVNRIAQRHRASIDVESLPGTGTTVNVHFPREEHPPAAPDSVRTTKTQ